MSCTSKCRMFKRRRDISRQTAKASGRMSSSVSPSSSRFLELLRLLGQCLVGQGREAGFESVDPFDDRAQRLDLTVVFTAEDNVQDLGQHAGVPLFSRAGTRVRLSSWRMGSAAEYTGIEQGILPKQRPGSQPLSSQTMETCRAVSSLLSPALLSIVRRITSSTLSPKSPTDSITDRDAARAQLFASFPLEPPARLPACACA
jgi:hypothetical protein